MRGEIDNGIWSDPLIEAESEAGAESGSAAPLSPTIRVLVADDDPLARRAIVDQLSVEDVRVVGQARGTNEAVALALELRPDIVVMDLLMPGSDGIVGTQRIVGQAPEVQVIILSLSNDDDAAMLALRSGAVGFVRKGIEMDALLRIVRGVHRGEAALDRAVTRRLIQEFRAVTTREDATIVRTQTAGSQLSRREQQILGLLVVGLTTEGIAAELGLAVETVRTHIKRILHKLHVHSRQEAIELARSCGALGPSPSTVGSILGTASRR